MRYVCRNIVRFPKKTLVIAVLISIILLLSMSCIFIINLCGEISDRTIGPLSGTVVVTDINGERFMLYEAAKEICSASSVIKCVDAIAEYSVQPIDRKCIGGSEKLIVSYSYYRGLAMKTDNPEDKHIESLFSRDMKLIAVTTTDICREFYSGEAELVAGTLISRDDNDNDFMKIVISDTFAELNGLQLGDKVKINALSMFIAPSYFAENSVDFDKDENRTYFAYFTYEDYFLELGENLSTITFTVGGIYHNLIDNGNLVDDPADLNDNRVYVPISVISKKLEQINSDKIFQEHREGYAYLKSVIQPDWLVDGHFLNPQDMRCVPTRLYFNLASPSAAYKLEAELNRYDFYKKIKLTPFTNEAGTSPAAKILIIVRYSLIGVTITGFAMLMLVVIFNMNARKREFSVLAALGMKRVKIALSFFGEIFVVFLAALLICGTIYSITVSSSATPISEYLENYEATADNREIRMSSISAENERKKQRDENLADIRYLSAKYIFPSLGITAVGAAIVLFMAFMPIYFSVKKLNPLTDGVGKE